jgi:hypothetical protein
MLKIIAETIMMGFDPVEGLTIFESLAWMQRQIGTYKFGEDSDIENEADAEKLMGYFEERLEINKKEFAKYYVKH